MGRDRSGLLGKNRIPSWEKLTFSIYIMYWCSAGSHNTVLGDWRGQEPRGSWFCTSPCTRNQDQEDKKRVEEKMIWKLFFMESVVRCRWILYWSGPWPWRRCREHRSIVGIPGGEESTLYYALRTWNLNRIGYCRVEKVLVFTCVWWRR